jgi:hypothetical protein
MVKDMYAIYESYATGNTIINNTERGNIAMATRPNSQGTTYGDLGQDNEETKIPKEIARVLSSLTKCAKKADYQQMLIDCMHLSKLASNLVKK